MNKELEGLKKKLIWWVALLGFCLSFSVNNLSAQSPGEKIELIHSDSLVYLSLDSGKEIRYLGNVFFRKGREEVRCDRATHYPDKELTILQGNVDYQDSSRSLKADYFEYYSNPERQLARGNVELFVDEKRILANEVSYIVDEKFAQALGDVRFFDLKDDFHLFCQKLSYDTGSKRVFAEIKPRLVKLDSLRNPGITIEAESLTYDDSSRTAVAKDSVTITHEAMVAKSMLAEYFRDGNRIVLTDAPKVVHQKNSEMTAERIELFFENDSLRQVYMRGKGVMLSHFLVAGEPEFDRLSGAEFWIDIKDDTVRNILVKGQATSTYHLIEEDQVEGVNQVLGDELTIVFEYGTIKDVFMASKPELSRGSYYPPKAQVKEVQ